MITLTASAMKVYDLEPRTWNNNQKAYTFSAVETRNEGNWKKFYMSVPPEIVPQFERLKIRSGSIVDIVAAPSYYKTKNGAPSISWVIKDIYISNTPYSFKNEESHKNEADSKAAEKESKAEMMQQQEETLASILLNFENNPFNI